MERVTEHNDPRRCKETFKHGQCMNKSEDGVEFCQEHLRGGKGEVQKRLYHLAQAQDRQRLAEITENEDLKSLREEIALNRMLIERRFNLIRSDADLLSACGPLNQLLLTSEKLVKSAHQMEQSLDDLLSKSSILSLGQTLAQIISEVLEGIDGYETYIDQIITKMFSSIKEQTNKSE